MNIKISAKSQKIIKNHLMACGIQRSNSVDVVSSIDYDDLVSWLNEDSIEFCHKSKKYNKFFLIALRTELLNDLLVSMAGDSVKTDKSANDSSKGSKIKFAALTVAGIVVAACQGFDNIVSLLSVFTIPSLIILIVGGVFSILSVVVFCGFDLVKVSSSLGVKLGDASKLLEVYLTQLQKIKAIRKKIDSYNLAELSQAELKKIEQLLCMLEKRFIALIKVSKQFEEALDNENIRMVKILTTGVGGLLFFGSGFFAGQSVALYVCSLVVNLSIPAFWPVLIFSIIIGVAAFSLYWYVERPGLNKLVSNWFGLNEESIKKICDKDLLAKETKKLSNLKEKVVSMREITHKLTQSDHDLKEPLATHSKTADCRLSSNFYSFLKQPSVRESANLACHANTFSVACSH